MSTNPEKRFDKVNIITNEINERKDIEKYENNKDKSF